MTAPELEPDGQVQRSLASEGVRLAAEELLAAVDAHKRYWPRVDWGSERCERNIEQAQAKLRAALAAPADQAQPGPNEPHLWEPNQFGRCIVALGGVMCDRTEHAVLHQLWNAAHPMPSGEQGGSDG